MQRLFEKLVQIEIIATFEIKGKQQRIAHFLLSVKFKEVVQTHSMLIRWVKNFFCSYTLENHIYLLVISTSLEILFLCITLTLTLAPFFFPVQVFTSLCAGTMFTLTSPADNLCYRFWKFFYSLTVLSVPVKWTHHAQWRGHVNIKSMKSHSFYCSWIFAY